jgi:Tfp pilus assembly protein PilV
LSLIEVLLALTILLLSLVAIGRLVDIGSDNSTDARMHVRGTRLAQAKMAEVEAGVISLQGGASGTFDDEPGWSFTVETEQQSALNLYRVTVKVNRDVRGKPFEITLSQFLLDPTRMGTAAQAEKPTATAESGTTTTTGGTP